MRVVKASGGFIGSRRRPCHFVFVTSRVVQANIAVSDDGKKRLCVLRDPLYWVQNNNVLYRMLFGFFLPCTSTV